MNLIVDVQVKDLDRAVKFYTDVLGFTCRIHEKEWAGIIVGDPSTTSSQGSDGYGASAEIHLYVDGGVTNSVEFYVDDIDAEVVRMKEKGVEFIPGMDKPSAVKVDKNNVTSFPWGRIAYFKDSEGNELALVKDN